MGVGTSKIVFEDAGVSAHVTRRRVLHDKGGLLRYSTLVMLFVQGHILTVPLPAIFVEIHHRFLLLVCREFIINAIAKFYLLLRHLVIISLIINYIIYIYIRLVPVELTLTLTSVC